MRPDGCSLRENGQHPEAPRRTAEASGCALSLAKLPDGQRYIRYATLLPFVPKIKMCPDMRVTD